jgi:hypothetical protein
MTVPYRKLKDTWIAENITSQEVVFIDNGEKNENYTSVWIRKEQEEEEEESKYVVVHQQPSFNNGYNGYGENVEEDDDVDAGPITKEETEPYFLIPKDIDDDEIIKQGDDEEGWLDDEDPKKK